MTSAPTAGNQPQAILRGHPRGLYTLFYAELWERFCYYALKAMLALYFAAELGYTQKTAAPVVGAAFALIYATGIFGGAIADHVLGYRRAILTGGVLMAAGQFLLVVPERAFVFAGLALMVAGNGLFKPNISTLVGKLYAPGDMRRDGGFTIFYMGINLGALLAPLISGGIGERFGWRWGFAVAGTAMLAGIATFALGSRRLGGHGSPPPGKEGALPVLMVVTGALLAVPVFAWLIANDVWVGRLLTVLAVGVLGVLLYNAFRHDRVQRDRIFGLILLLFANTVFWSLFEQTSNSLTYFGKDHVDRQLFFGEFLTTWFQAVNPTLIVILAPAFIWLWVVLERRRRNPSIPAKFGFGILQAAIGYLVLVVAIRWFPDGAKVPFVVMLLLYFWHTTGELCISPIGLSAMTKLAPKAIGGFVMGAWFLSISSANYIAGLISALTGKSDVGEDEAVGLARYDEVFWNVFLVGAGIGLFVIAVSPLINKLLHGVK